MICDGVNDLLNVLVKIVLFEKDETKKVYLTALLDGVVTMFLCILIELVCLPLGINRQVQGTLSISPIKKN